LKEADLDFLVGEIPNAIEQSLNGLATIADTVRAMCEFSKPGARPDGMVDLTRVVSDTLTVSRGEWKSSARIETDFESDLPLVPCHASELNQMLSSLIVNAAHAIERVRPDDAVEGEPFGLIRISAVRDGDWVELRVQDDGCGIPEEHQERVFDPFFSTRGVGASLGKGLTIARSVVVDTHGGTLRFESEPGSGTTFIVRLPLRSCAAAFT